MKKILTLSLIALSLLNFQINSTELSLNTHTEIQQSSYESLEQDNKKLIEEATITNFNAQSHIKEQDSSLVRNMLVGVSGLLGGLIMGFVWGAYAFFFRWK